MSIRPTLLIRSTVAASLLLVALGQGCKSKSEGGGGAPVSTAPISDLSSTVIGFTPETTLGFFQWDMTSPAYKKLAASPWGSGNDLFSSLDMQTPELEKVQEILKRVGIDPKNHKQFEELFSTGVVYAAPGIDNQNDIGITALIKSSTGGLADKMPNVKREFSTAGIAVQDLTVADGAGFSFDSAAFNSTAANSVATSGTTNPAAAHKIFVAWNKQSTAVGSNESLVRAALASKGGATPKLAATPEFGSATKGLPVATSRFGLAFVSLNDLMKAANALDPSTPPGSAAGDLPVKAIAAAFAMEDAPQTEFRVVCKTENDKQREWFAALNSSTSSSLLPAVPTNPLLFLSIDGTTIKRFKEMYAKSLGTVDPETQSLLAALDHIKRIGISARVAPIGQSFLPVPDIMIMAETDNAAATQKSIVDAASLALAVSGMPGGADWQDTKVNETPVKAYRSPMGFGVFLAAEKGLVIAASTEPQLKSSLDIISGKTPGLSGSLSARASGVLNKGEDLANVYFNFEQIAAMLESLKSTIAMFAPPGSPEGAQAQSFLEPARIESLKKMGSLIGSVTVQNELISVKSFYQAGTGQEVASLR